MPKREMTEEQRKAAAERLAKAREAKKAKELSSADAEPSPPAAAPAAPTIGPNDPIEFMIPYDPAFDDNNQFWERSFNGEIMRLRRGVTYTLPRYLVDFIESRTRIQREGNAVIAKYTEGNGVHLNF